MSAPTRYIITQDRHDSRHWIAGAYEDASATKALAVATGHSPEDALHKLREELRDRIWGAS